MPVLQTIPSLGLAQATDCSQLLLYMKAASTDVKEYLVTWARLVPCTHPEPEDGPCSCYLLI